jgi:hypothetical protein
MSPPEVWGPAVWRLFHTLIEKLNDNYYVAVAPQLFNQIVRICKFLPCPECSNDASNFLAKIKLSDMKNKTEFKNTFYLFHNWVNAKKRRPLFNYSNMDIYKNYRLIDVINNFITNYQTKGNMKLLTESFQRQLIIKDFKKWISYSMPAFIPLQIAIQMPQIDNNIINDTNNEIIEEQNVVEESKINIEEPVISEEVTVEESVINNDVEETTTEDSISEENQVDTTEDSVSEEKQVITGEESINNIEETNIVINESVKSKKNKKRKSKNKKINQD